MFPKRMVVQSTDRTTDITGLRLKVALSIQILNNIPMDSHSCY